MSIYNVIVIGAGISGVMTLKHLQEDGITNIICLDKHSYPFGVWNVKNHPAVLPSTYTVSSKLYMSISDFAMPNDVAEFPHHSVILNYYYAYAKHFDILKYIKQNSTVTSIYKQGNKWIVNTEQQQYYSYNIVIATGAINNCLNIPNDAYYKNFTGKIYHSDELRLKLDSIVGKKILLVGGSDTTSDYATALKNKNNVSISIKNGTWFQNRSLDAYSAADSFYSVYGDAVIKLFGKDVINSQVENNSGEYFTYWWGKYGSGIKEWTPKCKYLNSYYVKTREIIDSISKGEVIPHNGINDIDKNSITFESGKSDTFDIIIFCTGYKPLGCFSFFGEKQNYIANNLYKNIFFADDPTLMFVGFIRPYLTSIPMLSELQSRWISKSILTKFMYIPTSEDMHRIIIVDKNHQKDEFPCSTERLKTIVDPYDYANMVAKNIGANVNYMQLLSDPKLLYCILFDSWNHHMFRLNDSDPEKRNHAKNAILENHTNGSSIRIRKFVFDYIVYILTYIAYIIVGIIILYIYRNVIISYVLKTTKYIRNKIKYK